MTKVTRVASNPELAAEVGAAPKAPIVDEVIVDSLGRKLTVREPGILDESRLMRLLGEAATNTAYVLCYVMPVAMITSIDDLKTFLPSSQLELDARIETVGRAGIAAVMKHLEAKTGGEQDAVKNSAGPQIPRGLLPRKKWDPFPSRVWRHQQ
jgi:hypothetical protein